MTVGAITCCIITTINKYPCTGFAWFSLGAALYELLFMIIRLGLNYRYGKLAQKDGISPTACKYMCEEALHNIIKGGLNTITPTKSKYKNSNITSDELSVPLLNDTDMEEEINLHFKTNTPKTFSNMNRLQTSLLVINGLSITVLIFFFVEGMRCMSQFVGHSVKLAPDGAILIYCVVWLLFISFSGLSIINSLSYARAFRDRFKPIPMHLKHPKKPSDLPDQMCV
jgi:hypothetical protein